MSLLWIIHPDPNVALGLKLSVQQVWTHIEVQTFLPGQTPATMPQNCVALSADTLSDNRRSVMFGRGPQRFKTLMLQLRNLMRALQLPAELVLGACRLNTRTREWADAVGSTVMLTEKEVDLLVYLWQCDCAATREDLLKEVWEYASGVDTHTIETHIYRLRQKIETDPGNPQILITGKDGYQLNVTKPS